VIPESFLFVTAIPLAWFVGSFVFGRLSGGGAIAGGLTANVVPRVAVAGLVAPARVVAAIGVVPRTVG